MKTTLRTLAFALVASLAGAVAAQDPFWIRGHITVDNCYFGQSIAITQEIYWGGTGNPTTATSNYAVVPSNCSFTWQEGGYGENTLIYFTATTQCNGVVLTALDSVQFTSTPDTVDVYFDFNCANGSTPDCLGVPGGSAQPGTACTTFLGLPGTWTTNCECLASSGNCQACFNVIPGGPWAAAFNGNCTTGAAPFTYQWLLPDGGTSTSALATSQFAAPGIYGTCLTTTDGNGCVSTVCESVSVAASGAVNLYPPGDCNACWTAAQATDGLGLPIPFTVTFANCSSGGVPPYSYQYTSNGNWEGSLPPTMTVAFSNGYTWCMRLTDSNGCWSVTCMTFNFDADGVLITDPVMYDCLQIPNGPNMPGTPCENPVTGEFGTWSPDCDCIANSPVDCEGVVGGSALPGTPCQVPGTILQGTWSAACVCEPDTNTTGCQAGFWVIQAYEADPANPNGGVLPIPYELWVWNLSTGTSPFQFEWDFGDGTSSFDAYPTHVYGASGPYNLCLTMSDGAGCNSTYCDSVSIDGDGFYEGMVPESEVRNGFTIRVLSQLPTEVPEQRFDDSRVWPNPVTDALNLSFRSTVSGTVPVTIIDLNGRVMHQDNLAFARGENRINLSAAQLAPGMYVLRVGNDALAMNIRFIRQ
ncbi:MAG TPA: PKD domain-containing protein [Flavobacteriales bacterium]|nr:PKD domain-containing protein [Flavobacteriales bacterium]